MVVLLVKSLFVNVFTKNNFITSFLYSSIKFSWRNKSNCPAVLVDLISHLGYYYGQQLTGQEMILTKRQILKGISTGEISLTPVDESKIAKDGYFLSIGSTLKELDLNPASYEGVKKIRINKAGYTMKPEAFYLLQTKEKIGSTKYQPKLKADPAVSEGGLIICAGCGECELSAKKNWLITLSTHYPIKIYPNLRIGKVVFQTVK